MHFERSVQCGLNPVQFKVICRDFCKSVNYSSPDSELAVQTSNGLMSNRWNGLPEWVKSGEVYLNDNEVILRVEIESDVESENVRILGDELQQEMASLFSYKPQSIEKRVFCVGWPKTGTTSIIEALKILGFFSWQFAPWAIGCSHLRCEPTLPPTDFSSIYEYNAVSCLPFCVLFRELDEAFPGSLFILTTRSVDTWVPSAVADIAGDIVADGMIHTVYKWAYGTNDITQDILVERYQRHDKEVREYFRGRKDFLVIDLANDNPWEDLCAFLQLPIPSVAFPHKNRRE